MVTPFDRSLLSFRIVLRVATLAACGACGDPDAAGGGRSEGGVVGRVPGPNDGADVDSGSARPRVDAGPRPPVDAARDADRDPRAGAEADAPRDASPPEGSTETRDAGAPKPPFDWVGVIGTGQSLSVGEGSNESLSTSQPYKNIKLADTHGDSGTLPIEPNYPIASDPSAHWSVVPLVEPIRQAAPHPPGDVAGYSDEQYPNNIFGESPHSAMASELSSLWDARGGSGAYVTAHTVVGWSGHCLSSIDKEGSGRAYPASLNEAGLLKSFAAARGLSFGYGGVILTHGECDATNAAYGTGLFQLWKDYNTDLKTLTQQSADIVLIGSQQSTIAGYGNSAVQLWAAGVDHPGQIVCATPKYAYQYGADNLHLLAPGYVRLGQKYAEVFDLVVNQGRAWKPLGPNHIARAGAVITLDFDVPNPPLVWDTVVPPPHQTDHPAWKNAKGFEVIDSHGNEVTVEAVAIDGSSVVLTLAAPPAAGTSLTVGYALTEDGTGDQGGLEGGLRGQLRDSDELVGFDAEVISTSVTHGSAVVTSTDEGKFVRRTGRDLVRGAADAASSPGAVVLTHDTDSQLTLAEAWTGQTGTEMLSFHHDERNWCVHFDLPSP